MKSYLNVIDVMISYALQSALSEMSKGIITVELTDGKVDKVACHTVLIDDHDWLYELEALSVSVLLDHFLVKVIWYLQVFNYDLGWLLESYQAIDIPCVES